ncbi:MAG TPA: tetratricopeptide repeat protein, partial [Vulgatibacter sp.]|nr:tetratricopeptide repeat protein [Vulgatibacter sp.]
MIDDRLERGATPDSTAPQAAPNVAVGIDAQPNFAVEVPAFAPAETTETARRIAELEREIQAAGHSPEAARLLHEIGRLWETEQPNHRNAAIAWQNAYRLNPRHLPTLQSARRLFARIGNWSLVAQLLDAEVDATPDPAAQSALLFERGRVLDERLSRHAEAKACFDRALELDPSNLALLAHLESRRADDPGALAALRIRLAEAIADPLASARALAEASRAYEATDPAKATALLREAFAKAPGDAEIRARLCLHLERAGELDDLVGVLQSELAACEGAPADAAAIWHRVARLHLRLDREDDAVDALLAAHRLAPDEPLVAFELSRLYELREAWEPLAEVLETRASRAADGADRAALLVELAALLESRLNRPDRAKEHYLAALRLSPGDPVALAALGKLQHQLGDWEGLLRTFEAEALYARDPKQKAARTFQAAVILEEKLGRVDEAIARHVGALQLHPGYLPSQKALIRLYEGEGRYRELVAMLEQDLASQQDGEQLVSTLSEIAEVQAKKLHDPAAALRTHQRILEIAPGHLPSIRSMARLAQEAKEWETLVQALELEAVHTSDQRQVLVLLHRCAEVLEEKIGDRKRAIEAYDKVLSLAPSYLPALRALGRIYARRGMWSELLEMYRREAEIAPSPSAAAALVHQVAEFYEHKLCIEDKAIEAYREALSLSPTHLPAMRALARIYRSQGAWQNLVDVLSMEAGTRTDARERAAALCRVAELREERLDQRAEAKETYAEVLRLVPGHPTALRALDRLHSMDGEWSDVARILEWTATSDAAPRVRVAALTRLASLCLDVFSDPMRALRWCEAGLELAPEDPTLLRIVERVRTAQEDPAGRAEVRERLAAGVEDGRLSSVLLIQAAEDRAEAGAPEAAARALQLAVDADPRSEMARERLDASLDPERDALALAVVLERRAAASQDPELRAALLVRLAGLRQDRLGDAEGALAACREALSLVPGHLAALDGACRAAEALGDAPALVELLVARAEVERDPANAARSLARAGTIREADDPDAALELYHRAIERHPTEPTAVARIEAILAARGDAASVAQLYEERAARELDALGAADALVAAARIHQDHLGDMENAARLLDEALSRNPEHPEGLERRGAAAEARGDDRAAIADYGARLHLGGDPLALAPLHLRLARLHAAAGETGRALTHLQSALAADPSLAEALTLQARLHVEARNWAGAIEALRRLADRETDPASLAAIHGDLARIHEEGLGDLEGAAGWLERTLGSTPDDLRTLERLARLYERARNLPKLVASLEKWSVALVKDGQAERGAATLARAGTIFAGPLRDPIMAVQCFRQALDWSPDDGEIRTSLANLYAADPKFQESAVHEYRLVLECGPPKAQTFRALHRIWVGQGRRDHAFMASSVLHALRSADQAESAFFAQHHGLRPAMPSGTVPPEELDRMLSLPAERSALAAIAAVLSEPLARAIGARLENLEVQRDDRLKADHPLRRQLDRILESVAIDPATMALYTSPKSIVAEVALADAPVLVVGRDFTSRFQKREQAFLLGRVVWMLRQGSGFWVRFSPSTLADLLGAAVRLVEPRYLGLGTPDDDAVKRLRKALGRR